MHHGRNLVRRTAVIHCCVQSGERLQQHSSKEKKKSEIQIQMLKPDKISAVLLEITCIGTMLPQRTKLFGPEEDLRDSSELH